jgi:hexosaminidase
MPNSRIIPKPLNETWRGGGFVITPSTKIVADEPARECAGHLTDLFAPATGTRLDIISKAVAGNCIFLQIDPALSQLGAEGYRIRVDPDRVDVSAQSRAGLYYGVQTLRQLLPTEIFSQAPVDGAHWQISCGLIEDQPRFSWRGFMLDCARHFMPIQFIYKIIDLLALHKLNVFHWHLTDDQGWRIEIKKYPMLTEIGGWRKETLIGHALSKEKHFYDRTPHGGFYTQNQIRDLVKYAAARNITIVPEIEMPGHSQAAIAAYPHLGNNAPKSEVWTTWGVNTNILNVEESTIQFYQDVLLEVMGLFPSPYIHIGGDEAPKDQWKSSPRAQARIAELGLKNEDELQSWFVCQMGQFLAEHGRRLIGWDEILEGGLAPCAMVMSWRGEEGGIAAARAGHDVIMTPQKWVYFDHYQSECKDKEPLAIGGFTPIEKVYEYEPLPQGLEQSKAKHIRGAQAQLWTEYVPDSAHAEYMIFPRLCALAEVLWSPRDARDCDEFRGRLSVHLQRLNLLGVNYHQPD